MNGWPEWLHAPGAEAAGAALVHFLWQGAALWALAALSLRALAARPAAVRYGVACAFLAAMAGAPALTWWALMAQTQTPSGNPGDAAFAASLLAWPRVDAARESALPWVLIVWLAGVFVTGLRVMGAWSRAAWQMTRGRRPVPEAIAGRAQELAARLGIFRVVRVFASAYITVPAMWGVVRPVILLPAGLVAGLPPAQLEAILAHELAHAARWDFAVNALQCVVETLLFYHPGVWWVSREIRREREMACDEIAAELSGGRVNYSRAVLAVEESRLAWVLAAGGGDLKARVAWLLRRPAPAGRGSGVALWVALALLGIAVWSVLRTPAMAGADSAADQAERQRRIRYANGRFGDHRPGAETDRGRLYIEEGPPDEIESHPSAQREAWRYWDGRLYEFSGVGYPLVRQSRFPAVVLDRLSADQVNEPLRSLLRTRLAPFLGRPMSGASREAISRVVREVDPNLSHYYREDPPGSGKAVLELRQPIPNRR